MLDLNHAPPFPYARCLHRRASLGQSACRHPRCRRARHGHACRRSRASSTCPRRFSCSSLRATPINTARMCASSPPAGNCRSPGHPTVGTAVLLAETRVPRELLARQDHRGGARRSQSGSCTVWLAGARKGRTRVRASPCPACRRRPGRHAARPTRDWRELAVDRGRTTSGTTDHRPRPDVGRRSLHDRAS